MKRLRLPICLFALLVLLSSCGVQTRQDKVLGSVGEYDAKQFWTHGEFQDYTDFGMYSYSAASLGKNQYFTIVSETNRVTICEFIDDFEKWIDTIRNNDSDDELVLNYSFDRAIIDTEDYFYIYEGENYSKFGCYDVWFFDTQTNVLYYFHNNI